MTITYTKLPDHDGIQPKHAVAVLISSEGGLNVRITGYKQFELCNLSIESVVDEVSSAEFKWPKPSFGPMKSALSIGVPDPVTTVVFVLDRALSAEFSDSLPPIFAAGDESGRYLCNPKLWHCEKAGREGALVASITTTLNKEPQMVEFNMALDNVGVVGDNKQPYRTPFIIDPDVRHPQGNTTPPGGGASP